MEPEEEPHPLSPSELLHLSENHLRLRNFSLSSQYALESLHSTAEASNSHYGDQGLRDRAQLIIAVSDVLYAASQTLGSPVPNWYSVLGLDTLCSDDNLIRSKFRSLLLLLGPVKSTFPAAEEALASVWNAWNVLGNHDKKSDFDAQFQAQLAGESHVGEGSACFWTVCPYCYFMYEYAKVFEGFCLRCQNGKCRKVFQGISTRTPPPVRSNQDLSFSCMGYFPLGVSQLEGDTDGKQFAPWSPFVGMFELPVNRKTANGKGLDDYTATMDNGHEVSHAGNGPNVINRYTVDANGKMRIQTGTPIQMNRTANLTDGVENRGVAMEDNFNQYGEECSYASQDFGRTGYEYDPEADMQFVQKDGEIFLEVSSGPED